VRALVILFQIAAVVAVAYLIVRVSMRRRPVVASFAPPAIPAGGRWQARHYADEGNTVVAVARVLDETVLEEHVVARIPDWDDDWSRKFLAAKQEAEERAFHLNSP
jgi:hypothetical protein